MKFDASKFTNAMVSLESLEHRLLLAAWLPGNQGSFTDVDGDQYTVKLTGPGQVAVTIEAPDLDGHGAIDAIILEGTDPLLSKLTITAKSGTRGQAPSIDANSIAGSGLKSILAKNVIMVGSGIDLTGYLGSVTLYGLENAADILADGGSAQVSAVTIVYVNSGSEINLGSQISKFKAGGLDTCTITAPAIGDLTVSGSKADSLDGNCYADLVISGDNAPKGVALKSAKVAGWLEDCTWTVATGSVGAITAAAVDHWTANFANSTFKSLTTKGSTRLDICGDVTADVTAVSLGKFATACYVMQSTFTLTQAPDVKLTALGSAKIKGWIEDTSILATGNIGSIQVEGLSGTTIFAGVTATHDTNTDGVLDLPDPATEIALTAPARASIKSIKVTGDKWEDFSIVNSNIAAAEIGAAWIAYDRTVNGGVRHGLAADLIKKLSIKYDGGVVNAKNQDLHTDLYSLDDWDMWLV